MLPVVTLMLVKCKTTEKRQKGKKVLPTEPFLLLGLSHCCTFCGVVVNSINNKTADTDQQHLLLDHINIPEV